MDQKEFEIQRARGTVNTYNIEIGFPRREEPVGLDQLMSEIVPSATRFFNGSNTIFIVEMPPSYIKLLIGALTKLIQSTNHNSNLVTWVYIHEFIDGRQVHIYNYRIDQNESE